MNRTLDRLPEYDERSRKYNIRALLPSGLPRSYTWPCTTVLDQGQEGACVGFAWTHERIASPVPVGASDTDARLLYHYAQTVDEWPGENYDGTSVLAGAKASQQCGWITEYRWAFNTTDALAAISRHGPAVIGVNWRTGMFDPDGNGVLHVKGDIAGGHAILVRGVNVSSRFVVLHNSWGPGWGGTRYGPGTALVSWDDFDKMLSDDGECCVPVVRNH